MAHKGARVGVIRMRVGELLLRFQHLLLNEKQLLTGGCVVHVKLELHVEGRGDHDVAANGLAVQEFDEFVRRELVETGHHVT